MLVNGRPCLVRRAVHAALGASSMALCSVSYAQAAESGGPQVEEVVVTGYRQALRSALDEKRDTAAMVDVINAEDIADFPDANLAESLQRLPGVSIDRDNGEGRSITVRGLGSDFTRVRINGLEALSTAGANDSGTSPNRGRGFDFNTFASELFSSLKVQKTSTADVDEGSLGATVDLIATRPLDFDERQLAFSVQDAYYEVGETHNPRIAGLIADQWFDGRLGVSMSAAYNKREQEIDSYRRAPGTSRAATATERSHAHTGVARNLRARAKSAAAPGSRESHGASVVG